MHEFDMQALLAAFDNNPEKLAQAFTDQLNAALAIKKREEELYAKADHLTAVWNDFVEDYFAFYYPEDENEEYKKYQFLNGKEIMATIALIIQSAPEINKYLQVFENINSVTNKINTNLQSAKELIEPTTDEFKRIMKDFFDKYDI